MQNKRDFMLMGFQLTAARRRLGVFIDWISFTFHVSTHSRPKAAGRLIGIFTATRGSFNSQPPEGGWCLR